MKQDYWQKQGKEPLFPNLLWSRPETRQGAGKLLIIGGQAQEFSHVAECYSAAERAGAGTIRILMPDSTQKATSMLPNIEYAPSNQSGSFAREALSELIEAAHWADGVLLAGDLGKNSETTLMLESFITKYHKLLIISPEAVYSLPGDIENLLRRVDTLLALDLQQLQKVVTALKFPKPATSHTSNVDLAEILHKVTEDFQATVLIKADPQTWISSAGKVVSSPPVSSSKSAVTATAAVWAIQNPAKVFEATVTSLT